ncbi:MAG: hypothetical protein H0V84_06395 [Actinobacteria bacterium]|nr:hypothetical protein [Actinomycetota bacterium]
MLNKRNAMLGWAVWKLGKRVAKRKARAAMPGGEASGKARGLVAILPALAAAAGALWFWRRRDDDEGDEPASF